MSSSSSQGDGVNGDSSCGCLLGGRRRRRRQQPTLHRQRKQGGFAAIDRDDYDVELAKEMNELSVQERERVMEDIHGVGQDLDETPEHVAKALAELDTALVSVPKRKRRAWERAVFLRPRLETDQKFKLMFLRADMYDAPKAAKRLTKYFEDKLEFFGDEKLVKEITVKDLTKEDMKVFNAGWALELPHKDQVGRPIWFWDVSPTRCDYQRGDSLIRCNWYLSMATLQEESSQIKGICNVSYAPGNLLDLVSSLVKLSGLISRTGDIIGNLPMRISSYHFCYNDLRTRTMLSLMRNFFNKHIRLRIKAHFGSDIELAYSLATYGVPCRQLLDGDNSSNKNGEDIKVQLHKEYIVRRREIERLKEQEEKAQELATGIILYPKPNDVLIGRGRPYYTFTGSVRFGAILDAHLDRYLQCSEAFEKTCLSMDIVKTVQEYGGRFIERTESGWTVIDDVVAREKVSVGFRSRVSKLSPGDHNCNANTKKARPPVNGDALSQSAKRLRYDS